MVSGYHGVWVPWSLGTMDIMTDIMTDKMTDMMTDIMTDMVTDKMIDRHGEICEN